MLLPDAVAIGRRALPQSPFGRHEVNFAEKRLPSAFPITGRRFIHVSEQCIVCCIAFRLLYRITDLFTILLVYIVLILDCVGYFHRPKKPLIQSRYTHISECFSLARLRWRIKDSCKKQIKRLLYIVRSISFETFSPETLILLKSNWNFSRSRSSIPWIRCICYSAPVTSRRPRCRALKGACSDRLSQLNYLQTSWKQHLLNLSFSFEISEKTWSDVWVAARWRSSLDAHLYQELCNHDKFMTWRIFHDPAGLENVSPLARKCLPEAPCLPTHGIPG